MEEIKAPKKERKFLKAVGNIAKVLANELVMGIGRKFIDKAIDKVGNKKQGLSIVLIILASSFAFAQYPNTGNKQRLGFQTTGDGLTWRGSILDTASIQPINNQSAWVILDTVNLKFYSFDFTSNVWNLIGGSAAFTQPVDSLFFNTGVPTNNVDTAKMRWDSDLATVVLGLNDNVPNELGFKNFWLVKNQTGSTITKGSIVYANGTVGASGRITVAKFIANGSIDAKYLLGITAHDLSNGEDGYVISFGKIRQVNTDTFAAGAILYPSPTVAGVWTDIEPVAPNIDMPIGFCINSHVNNGTIAIRVASGYKLSELHDVAISSPVDKASLYYSGGLWRDTTAALLVSDTASMLTNYLRTGTAASTYLPLTGGTISGASSANNYTDTLLNVNYQHIGFPTNQNVSGIITNINTNGENAFGILSEASTIYKTAIGVKGKANLLATGGNGVAYGILGEITANAGGGSASNSYAGYFNNTSTVSDGNHYGLFVNTASGGDYGIYQTGSGINYFGSNTSIGGTLGVTSAATFESILLPSNKSSGFSQFSLFQNANTFVISGGTGGIQFNNNINSDALVKIFNNGNFKISNNQTDNGYKFEVDGTTGLQGALTVNSSAVFNEAATDSDFRVESEANANMLFVDASTSRVGIGYASPTKTLDVNGEVRINTVTATPTSLLGKDGSNVVGNVTLGSSLTLSSGTLSVNNKITDINTSSYSILSTDYYIDNFNSSSTTIILPLAGLNLYRELKFKNSSTGALTANGDIIPLSGSGTTTTILSATNAKWCTLVSDGTYWRIMQSN